MICVRFQDLVHRAIALSGSATAGWAIHRFGLSNWRAENVAAYVRCEKQFDNGVVQEVLGSFQETANTKECNLQDKIPECVQVCTTYSDLTYAVCETE